MIEGIDFGCVSETLGFCVSETHFRDEGMMNEDFGFRLKQI